MSAALYETYNLWASAVLYPAVPIGTSILRVIPTASHTAKDVAILLAALSDLKGRYPEAPTPKLSATP